MIADVHLGSVFWMFAWKAVECGQSIVLTSDLFIPPFPSTPTLKAAGDEQEREGLVNM